MTTELADATSARITFERIGRNRAVEPIDVTFEPESTTDQRGRQMADAVYRHARRSLGSRVFEVDVCHDGRVLIELGRFGRGAWVAR